MGKARLLARNFRHRRKESLPIFTLDLDFLTPKLDDRITFTRASDGTYLDGDGTLQTASSNSPRFDHRGTKNSLGLLIERERENLLLRSEEIDNAVWLGTGSVTANQATAPDGNLAADEIAGANPADRIRQVGTVTAAAQVGSSVFVKNVDATTGRLSMRDTTNGSDLGYIDLNWSGATLSSISEVNSPEDSGFEELENGWYRVWVVDTMGVGGTSCEVRMNSEVGGSTASSYFWGVHLNEGESAGSYIATAGSTVTRQKEVATFTGTNFSDWFNQTEGTFIIEWSRPSELTSRFGRIWQIDSGANNDRMALFHSNSAATVNFAIFNSGAGQTSFSSVAFMENTAVKSAIAYRANDVQIAHNGTSQVTDSSVSLPTYSAMYLGADTTAADNSYGDCHIRRVTYFPTRLPQAQLEALTA